MFENSAITVEKLVDQALRIGNLHDGRSVSDARKESVLAEFQLVRQTEEYRFGQPLTHHILNREFNLTLFGSVDAVKADSSIEFLAYTPEQPRYFDQELAILDWARVKVLSYLYAKKHDLDEVTFTIFWYHPDSQIATPVSQTLSFIDLEKATEDIIEIYISWATPFAGWPIIRDKSIAGLEFPFSPYRTGQREMMHAVYHAQKSERQALVEAPTGIGKTLASLFPAIKGLEQGFSRRLFYLTARTTGQAVAEDALRIMHKEGLRIKAVTITAKGKTCARKDKIRECDDCKYAEGYYTRLKGALHAAYKEDLLYRDTIEAVAEEFVICPFELALDLSLHADVIIGDYNYVFDPHVYLKRFFAEIEENYTFLIDEVHNLVGRGRSMFSATVIQEDIQATAKRIRLHLPEVYDLMQELLVSLDKEKMTASTHQGHTISITPPYHHFKQIRTIVRTIDEWLAQKQKKQFKKDLLDCYFSLRHFLAMGEKFDETYVTVQEISKHGFETTLFNINPAPNLRQSLKFAASSILFSATVSPHNYFKEVLGLNTEASLLSLPSPFPAENLKVICADKVSTRYNHRATTIEEVTAAIETMIHYRSGNYMIFFPSYEYLGNAVTLFHQRNPKVQTIVQQPEMTEEERSLYLSHFDLPPENDRETLVGFAVMGGVFGEGIDLVGERLNGVIIVGVGLPGMSPQQEQIRRFFDSENQGFDYAFTYPGINKVLQAAGRVIRTEEDRGVVLLIDDRFATEKYRHLFPPQWQPQSVRTREDVEKAIELFYVETDMKDDLTAPSSTEQEKHPQE